MVDGIGSAGKQQAVTTRINESGLRRSSSISTDPVFTAFVAVLSKCSKGVSGYFLFSFFLESNLFSALVGTLDFSFSFSMSLTNFSSLVHLFLEDAPSAAARCRDVIILLGGGNVGMAPKFR